MLTAPLQAPLTRLVDDLKQDALDIFLLVKISSSSSSSRSSSFLSLRFTQLTFIRVFTDITLHGWPELEWRSREPVRKLYHPAWSGHATNQRWDFGSGGQSGVEEWEPAERWERVAANGRLSEFLRPEWQNGQISAEVRQKPQHKQNSDSILFWNHNKWFLFF